MATLEDATKLGLAVQEFLVRPRRDPLPDEGISPAALRQRLTAQLQQLEYVHVLSLQGLKPLVTYVETGTAPEAPTGDGPLNTEALLAYVVSFLAGSGVSLEKALLFLLYIVDAAVDGATHAGPDGSVSYAALAVPSALYGLKPL